MSYTTYAELQEVVKSQPKFKKFLITLLKRTESPGGFRYSGTDVGVPLVRYGDNDGYYWDETRVELNSDGETLTVTFDIGSGSGYVPINFTEYEVTIEQFRQYILNRKWNTDDIDTLELLLDELNNIEGSHITERREDFK